MLEEQGREAAPGHLHRTALRIYAARSALSNTTDAAVRSHLTHVSGAAFAAEAAALPAPGYVMSLVEDLSEHCFSHCSRVLVYDDSRPIGRGNNAVYRGQDMPSGVFEAATLALQAHAMLAWQLARPFSEFAYSRINMAAAPVKFSSFLCSIAAVLQQAMERFVAACMFAFSMLARLPATGSLSWTAPMRSSLRDVAVKRLLLSSTGEELRIRDAQSAVLEVVISLHVSQACANCPYLGKALGFEVDFSKPETLVQQPIPTAHGVFPTADFLGPRSPLPSAMRPLPLMSCPPDADGTAPSSLRREAVTRLVCKSAEAQKASITEDPTALLLALELYECDLSQPLNTPSLTEAAPGTALCGTRHSLGTKYNCKTGCGPVSVAEYLLWLKSQSKTMPLQETTRLAAEIAEAVCALHNDAHVMHLDIKPQNVLLDAERHAKLVDFGFALAFSPERPAVWLARGRGTMRYAAPEMVTGMPGIVTPAADIFSLGGLLLTMSANHVEGPPLAGSLIEPFFDVANQDALREYVAYGLTPTIHASVPPCLSALISRCLAADPTARPTAEQVLVYLTSLHDAVKSDASWNATARLEASLRVNAPLGAARSCNRADDIMRRIVCDAAPNMFSKCTHGDSAGSLLWSSPASTKKLDTCAPGKLTRPRKVLRSLQGLANAGCDDRPAGTFRASSVSDLWQSPFLARDNALRGVHSLPCCDLPPEGSPHRRVVFCSANGAATKGSTRWRHSADACVQKRTAPRLKTTFSTSTWPSLSTDVSESSIPSFGIVQSDMLATLVGADQAAYVR